MKSERVCSVCGVKNDVKKVVFYSKADMFLCNKHLCQMRRYNMITDPTARTIQDKNEIIKHEDYAEIIIRNQKNEIVATTMIDLEDVDKVKTRKWNVLPTRTNTYIYSKHPQHTKLHRLILDYYGPLEIDHINHNSLDNRKQNLRIVTRSENASNTNAKLVHKHGKKWYYEFVRYGKRFRGPGFATEKEAYAALQAHLKDVSARVDELIDQFNKQAEINPFKGVYLHYGKYQGVYYHKGKKYYAGTFDTPDQACDARAELIARLNAE